VIVAVPVVRVVQVIVHEVVHVIAVRNRLMATSGAMLVSSVVPRAGMLGRALSRIVDTHLERVLDDLATFLVVQMAVVQVVHMARVAHGRVTAVGTVLVVVTGVLLMMSHGSLA
jgi:hypothetical protein